MGHDHHFLSRIDRVGWSDAELALSLYRDHFLVKELTTLSGAPPEADRLAISLRDPVEGPFVLVERNGHFVTCLGEGMHTDLPVISRQELDTVIEKRKQLRAATELLIEDEERITIVARAFKHGELLYREDLPELRAVQPALCHRSIGASQNSALDMLREMGNLKTWVSGKRTRLKVSRQRVLYRLLPGMRNMAFSAGLGSHHLTIQVMRAFPVGVTPTGPMGTLGVSSCALMSAWWAAQVGCALLPRYIEAFAAWQGNDHLCDALTGLVALASRYPECRNEVRRVLEEEVSDHVDQLRVASARRVLEMIDQVPNLVDELGEMIARRRVPRLSRVLDAHGLARDVPPDEALGIASHLMFEYLEDPQRFHDLLVLVSAIVQLPAERLCLPRELPARHVPRLSHERTMQLMHGIARYYTRRSRGTAAESVDRNAACPCGSGKKSKRCCGKHGPKASAEQAKWGRHGGYLAAADAVGTFDEG